MKTLSIFIVAACVVYVCAQCNMTVVQKCMNMLRPMLVENLNANTSLCDKDGKTIQTCFETGNYKSCRSEIIELYDLFVEMCWGTCDAKIRLEFTSKLMENCSQWRVPEETNECSSNVYDLVDCIDMVKYVPSLKKSCKNLPYVTEYLKFVKLCEDIGPGGLAAQKTPCDKNCSCPNAAATGLTPMFLLSTVAIAATESFFN